MVGIVLFAVASLAGGFATEPAWLLIARVVQGVGGAIAAPTSLSLIAATFPEGKERNRAMGVYAAMTIAGAARRPDRRRPADQLRRLALGVLRQRADRPARPWSSRPAGARRASSGCAASSTCPARSPPRWASPPWSTGCPARRRPPTGSRTGATPRSSCRWSRPWSCWPRSRSSRPGPSTRWCRLRVLKSATGPGAYLISLCVGTAIFGMFFFLTIFVQQVWGYSPVRSGVAYLPMVALILVGAGLVVPPGRPDRRAAADDRRPGAGAGGMFWLSRITETSTYVGGLLGPIMLVGLGMGLTFVPLSLVALAKVPNKDSGVASSLLNTGQQVGGSIGLAVLGTVAWSAVSSNARSATAAAGRAPLQGPGTRDHQPLARLRVRARVPGGGRDRPARPGHRGGDDPGDEEGPGGHRPDGGTHRLRPSAAGPG